MNGSSVSLTKSLLLPILFLTAIAISAQQPSYLLVSAPLQVAQKTDIPGRILAPGSYSIRIVDHLKDRFILQVDDSQGNRMATFIGLHNPDFEPFVALKQRGPIFWTASPKGTTALRAFSFPNGNTLEFVYPKAEAVTLAKLNTNSVPAIDPESEGRRPDPRLSPEDREVVTLWMLTATRVGPKQETPAIEAKRFVAPAEQAETNTAPVQTATATPPPPPQAQPAPATVARLEPTAAPPRVHSSVKRLPQTASDLPLLLLVSLLLFSAAGTLHFARFRA